jgi:hypothetical protein
VSIIAHYKNEIFSYGQHMICRNAADRLALLPAAFVFEELQGIGTQESIVPGERRRFDTIVANLRFRVLRRLYPRQFQGIRERIFEIFRRISAEIRWICSPSLRAQYNYFDLDNYNGVARRSWRAWRQADPQFAD